MAEEITQDTCTIKIPYLAALILGVRDKIIFDGDDEYFASIANELLAYQVLKGNTPYYLVWNSEAEYTRGIDAQRAKGRWTLWNRVDWELSEANYIRQKAAADERVEMHNDREVLKSQLLRAIALSMGCSVTDEIVNNIASAVMHTKNKMMASHYKCDESLVEKVWGH